MTDEISLDDSQASVAYAPAHERQYVIAGAGQGKTQVMVERIQHLVDDEDLNPADEILVLSFSRAAVEAARRRAAKSDLDQVTVRTFDSLAALIILELGDPDERLSSFEARIRKATELLQSAELPDSLAMLKHLFIDEAQDLVGDRAKLAEALIAAVGNDLGFTVLGDPLQGIYDFQLQDSLDKTTARELMDRLFTDHGAKRRELTRYYRAKSERALQLVDVGTSIRNQLHSAPATKAEYDLLDGFRASRPTCAPFEMLAGLLYPDPETTAVLCATNYEVLRASEVLAERDIEHTVRRRAQDLGAAPWIWDALGELAPTSHSRDDILGRLEDAGRAEPEDDWLALKQCEGNSREYQSLDLQRLARRIMGGSIPVALTVNDEASVTVSTVHRAKGLEFDNVLYIEPDDHRENDVDFDELTRRTYVALSRARDSIESGRITPVQSVYRKMHDKAGRWTEMHFGKPRAYVSRFEIMSDDVGSAAPYAPDLNGPEILDGVRATKNGSEVTAVRITDGEEGQPARYEFRNQAGQALGRSSASFGADVRKIYYKWGRSDWPKYFSGIRLASIECAAGSPDQTEEVGLGRSGLWLVPRFVGLARAHWKDPE